MRHAHFRLLLAATLCVSGGTAEAWTGPAPEADRDAPAENAAAESSAAETAASLDEILDALGLDALAVDMFLKIDGIKGESTARGGHEDWIEIESFGWGESRPSGGTGQGRRRSLASFSDVSVVKKVDAASPNLYLACASGKHYPTAVLEVRKAGSRESYFTIRMENVLVSSVSVSHSADQAEPIEEVSLTYGKIHWEYAPQDGTGPGGKVEASWNLQENKQG
jgi:type VI secretion system secreted protein Hcp